MTTLRRIRLINAAQVHSVRRDIRILAAALALVSASAAAQQAPDLTFHFVNAHPAFASGKGPRVCTDVAHINFQSAERNPGSFRPLAALLESDGYRVRESRSAFSRKALAGCDVLIVADASAGANARTQFDFPRRLAFTSKEVDALYGWIHDGGGLLMIADHAPTPAALAEIGYRLGITVQDGFARVRADSLPDVFARNRGELGDHAILRGRNAQEVVDSVDTFTGHAFWASRDWSPLLKFGDGATGYLPQPSLPRAEWPSMSLTGWLQAAARQLGSGRVVWLGEVSACTALHGATGMNNPGAAQNAQFCLNINRWLSRALDP